MAVEHNIQQIDEEGTAGNVLSDYQVHTISLVGKGALGRNITKLKSNEEFIETEEGKAIMSKIDKAKALDAEQAELEAVASEEVVETEKSKSAEEQTPEVKAEVSEDTPEETSEVEAVVEQTEGESPSEDVTEALEEESEPVEKAKAKDKVKEEDEDEKEEEEEVEADSEGEEEDAKKAVEPKNEDEKVEKQKMYSVDEYLEASKSALDGVAKLVAEIKAKAPEANTWEVFDVVYSAVYKIEDAQWCADDAMWEKVWDEVYTEVSNRTSKAKSLKVAEEATLDDKLKALEVSDPALAALFRETSQKALHAEQEREAVIRAKAREEGAEKYKRISSEECTTDQITDTMIDLEVSNPEAYSIIAKALDNASVITSAGELFRDVGSSDTVNTMSPDEFVEVKSKSLAAEKDKAGESYNMAALRATVRQSDEYVANYA
tara:strand:+ start:73686 stop:74987 length:1302 start_codon:yes stop_codon:yes gene_type:complete